VRPSKGRWWGKIGGMRRDGFLHDGQLTNQLYTSDEKWKKSREVTGE